VTTPQSQQRARPQLTPPVEDVDYTKLPAALEAKVDQLDTDGALRPTIINPDTTWEKRCQKSLLSQPGLVVLKKSDLEKERNKAWDLLDALTRSGSLAIDQATLHVVIAATHCFDKSLINTLVQDSVNPIEKVERSSLLVASTIHQISPVDLVADEELDRVATYSPMLIGA